MKVATCQFLLIPLLIYLFSVTISAQEPNADKLRLQISNETNDTTKANLLIKLALKGNFGSSERINCFRTAFYLSKKKNHRYGMAFGKYFEVLELSQAGSYDEAIVKSKHVIEELDSMRVIQFLFLYPLAEIRGLFNSAGKQEEKFRYYQEKLAFYNKYGPVENTADCYHGIAGYYWYLSDFDKAIEYYMRARDVYRSFDPLGYASETQVIGSEYLAWGNLDKAEEYLKSALADLIRLNEAFYCYHQLGDLYFIRQDYAKALQYYFLGKQYCSYPDLKAINLVNCATVYLQLERMDRVRFYLDSAEKIRQKEHLGLVFPNGNAEIDFTFYKYYLANNNKQLALQRLEAAMRDAQYENYLPLILKYANELSSFLLKQGDSLRALRYLVQYHTIQDSINTMNTKARIASFEIEQQQQQKENEIEQLQTQKTTQRNYYLIGGAFLLLIVLAVISRIFYKRKRDKEQLTTDFKKQLAQAETKALRAQMNPHFIFNSLNSINSFVMDQKHEIASDYLIRFSKLIRLILDNSRSETISIEKELETLKLYVVLEAARFDNKFKCVYHVDENVDTHSIMIPPMLLQPFVENAIWHGLMQKEGEGTITIEISMNNEQITDNSEQLLNISITDDGIGREKAAELKSKSATHKSHGLKVTSQRIEMMNKINSTGAQVNIIDLKDGKGKAMGTRVELVIPF